MQYSYRVTKYNPENRNELGHYLFQDEWTCYSEVGHKRGNKTLTIDEYLEIEKKYIDAVVQFMTCLGISTLKVNSLERDKNKLKALKKDLNTNKEMIDIFNTIKNGDSLNTDQVRSLCKLILRNYIWCRLENNFAIFVHFGWDYYMYIGSKNECRDTIEKIEKSGLFVEDFESPYLDDEEE